MIPKPLAVAIVCLVTLVWIANFAAQFVVPGYTVDGWVHTIFLSVVGGALAVSRKGKGPNDPADPPGLPPGPDAPPPPPAPDASRPGGGAHRALSVLLPWRPAT